MKAWKISIPRDKVFLVCDFILRKNQRFMYRLRKTSICCSIILLRKIGKKQKCLIIQ